jgi:hypothetical protein
VNGQATVTISSQHTSLAGPYKTAEPSAKTIVQVVQHAVSKIVRFSTVKIFYSICSIVVSLNLKFGSYYFYKL